MPRLQQSAQRMLYNTSMQTTSAPAFEPYKKHKRGHKTFIYLYLTKTWVLNLIGLGCIYLAYLMYYGALNYDATAFFARHFDSWYITVPMFSNWMLLLGLMILVLAYMIGWRFYVHYKFIFDDHAFHLHRGFFFIRETTIPYEQVSNVHIARPYMYRMAGLAQLDIVTAADKSLTHGDRDGGKTKEFLIPLIDTSKARALSKQLISFSAKIRKGEELFESLIDVDDEDEDEIADSDNDEIESVEEIEETVEIAETAETTDDADMPKRPVTAMADDSDEIGEIDDITQLEFIADEDSATKKVR